MARKPRLFAPGVLYHVIVRGNQRQKTFLKQSDYEAYLEKLVHYRRKCHVTIYAYCLMPNHVHLLLECSRTPLAKFMQGLQQTYTQYYNLILFKIDSKRDPIITYSSPEEAFCFFDRFYVTNERIRLHVSNRIQYASAVCGW